MSGIVDADFTGSLNFYRNDRRALLKGEIHFWSGRVTPVADLTPRDLISPDQDVVHHERLEVESGRMRVSGAGQSQTRVY